MNTAVPTFNWYLVRSFLAALEHCSLLGAARSLHISQPTLGRHIAELEAQWGVLLFERTGRGLRPTEMAERLADSARSMAAAAAQLSRCTAGAQQSIAGTVRITASQAVAYALLPPVLAHMRRELPDIQVVVVASNALSNLLGREADIALRMVRPDQATLVAKRIGQVALGAYAHRAYLQRRGTPRQLSELLTHDLIGQDRQQEIIQGFAALGTTVSASQFAFRTDDLMVYWQALRAGLGIGFTANYLARRDPHVRPVLPHLKIAPLPVWLAVHREIRSSPRIRAVYDFLAQAIPPLL